MNITTMQKEGEAPLFNIHLTSNEAAELTAFLISQAGENGGIAMAALMAVLPIMPAEAFNRAVADMDKEEGNSFLPMLAIKLIQAKKNTKGFKHD